MGKQKTRTLTSPLWSLIHRYEWDAVKTGPGAVMSPLSSVEVIRNVCHVLRSKGTSWKPNSCMQSHVLAESVTVTVRLEPISQSPQTQEE
jgi:hypothetical protein